MNVVVIAGGALMVAVALLDVFRTLFHPASRGSVAMGVFRVAWAVSGRLGSGPRAVAGPAAIVAVITLWATMLAVGWALVVWPGLPGDFIFSSSLDADDQDGFVNALYYSWVVQSTLGFGDVTPNTGLQRMLAPIHASIGFGLFTVAVTWVLSIYPALHRQRATAALAHTVVASHQRLRIDPTALAEQAPEALARQLERISEGVTTSRVDLVHYPSTFYFASPSPKLSLAAILPDVLRLARDDGLPPGARLAAAELHDAVDELAVVLAREFLTVDGEGTDATIEAYRGHAEVVG